MIIKSKQILHIALEIEQMGIEFYDKLKELFAPGSKSYTTLIMLRNNEIEHKEKYNLLLKRTQSEKKEFFHINEKELQEIKTLIGNKIFDEMESAKNFFIGKPDVPLILLYAIGIEYDTFYFYNKLVDKVVPAEKDLIKEILKEEKAHIEKLMFLRTELRFDSTKNTEIKNQGSETEKK